MRRVGQRRRDARRVCVAAGVRVSSVRRRWRASGAVAAIIVNTDFAEGAADNWVGSHDRARSRFPPCPSAAGTETVCCDSCSTSTSPTSRTPPSTRARTRDSSPRVSPRTNAARPRGARGARRDRRHVGRLRERAVPRDGRRASRRLLRSRRRTGRRCRLVRAPRTPRAPRRRGRRGADPSASKPAFACACAQGYEGDACERRAKTVPSPRPPPVPVLDGPARNPPARDAGVAVVSVAGAETRGGFRRGDVRGRRGALLTGSRRTSPRANARGNDAR